MAKVRTAVILAAGESSRFWPLASDKHKAMYEILGKPILQYTVEALKRVGMRDIVIVVSPSDKAIRKYFGNGKKFGLRVRYAVQPPPPSMAKAILAARSMLPEEFVVVNAASFSCDAPLKVMLKKHKKGISLASATTKSPQLYGIFRFSKGKPIGVVEKPKHAPSNQRIIGVYLLNKPFLALLAKHRGHYGLEEALNIWLRKGQPATVVRVSNYPEVSLKYPWHLFTITKLFMDKLKQHRGKRAKIHRTAQLQGKVWLGNNVRIMEYAVIKGPCYIGDNSVIGTANLIRDYTSLGKNVHTGYKTEIKHSILYDNIKLHACFIGDSILDQGCRFAANTVTANRRLDRKFITTVVRGKPMDIGGTFFGTICGRNVRTGVHSSVMPGVKIGSSSGIGPNTAVFKDIPDHTLEFAKFKRLVRKKRG